MLVAAARSRFARERFLRIMAASAAARALWSGSINFGLISVPVKLYTAVRPKDVHFRMLHDQDLAPIRHRMECSADGKEVPREHMLRGYEIRKDQYIIISDEELEKAKPPRSKGIRIDEFVDPDDIDPILFERTYFLGPGKGGEKLYALLVKVLVKTKKAGVAQFVMRGTNYLGAIRVMDGTLRLNTMRFHDEVVPARDIEGSDLKVKLNDREVKMAQGLIDSLSGDFDPEQYKDEYTDRVMDLIERKARGEEVTVKPAEDLIATPNKNLLKVLQESIKHAKSGGRSGSTKSRRRRAAART
jgi:DNA end-binding protein Ku